MRKIVLSTFLLFSVFCCFGQTSNKRVCRLGFTYDISQNSNWGKNNLVVTSVSPYSNAEKAGIQPYDIITHIESIPVSDVSNDEIAQLLNPANKRNIMLTIKSTSSPSREVILNKECKQINEISEKTPNLCHLAPAGNTYMEDLERAGGVYAVMAELAKAAAHQDHNPFYDAPTVILVFAKMTNLAPMEDGCTAIENMLLAAKSLGIGTCWIYAVNALFASDAGMAWQDAHGIGKEYAIVGSLAAGYPAGAEPQPKEHHAFYKCI